MLRIVPILNGAWGPAHHLAAADRLQLYAKRAMPIVTLMDTPGADAKEEANRDNQATVISRLIAEASNLDVPNVGIVYGLGYSGGAIPLAASNIILAVRDGVFSTIQPRSLASIARRLNLSWQECAKYVGLSPYELYAQGNIDGVIDWAPATKTRKTSSWRSLPRCASRRQDDGVCRRKSLHPGPLSAESAALSESVGSAAGRCRTAPRSS